MIVLALALACTDYGLNKPGGTALPRDTGDGGSGGGEWSWDGGGDDTGGPADDEGDGGGGDGGGGDGGGGDGGGGGGDGGSDDGCWEPEDGYTLNPASRLVVTDGTTPITVTFTLSDTDYQDELWLDAPDTRYFVSGWDTPVGTSFALGPYAPETELVFAVQVLDTGMRWQSGPAERNADGVVHGGVTYEGACSFLIGFEDLTGGGDLDYNDVVMRVEGPLRQDR